MRPVSGVSDAMPDALPWGRAERGCPALGCWASCLRVSAKKDEQMKKGREHTKKHPTTAKNQKAPRNVKQLKKKVQRRDGTSLLPSDAP